MQRFAELFYALDGTTKTSAKLEALELYFRQAPPGDAAWALALFTGRRVKRAVSSTQLRAWAAQAAGLPAWIVDESHGVVGDLGETLSLILPPVGAGADGSGLSLREVMEGVLVRMSRSDEAGKRAILLATWARLDQPGKLVFHKLISGTFRLGVSRLMAVRALASVAGVDQAEMDHRVTGDWAPTEAFFAGLLRPSSAAVGGSTGDARVDDARGLRPFPFFLAHQVPDELDRPDLMAQEFGDVARWLAEWKWDGIRGQLLAREAGCALWSRGEELLSENFPELLGAARALAPGTTLDGEVLAYERGAPLDFALLQRRILRKETTGRLFAEVPVVFVAYDLLEHRGRDVRALALRERRALLEQVVAGASETLLRTSEVVTAQDWQALEALRAGSRARGVEGLMLKRADSTYGAGRTKLGALEDRATAGWWKWKIEPHTLDCVLIAAQRGSGRRASLYTDYTFGVWSGGAPGEGELVTITKAYHGKGMTDEVFVEIDRFIREHTVGRIGGAGIRLVEPRLVFEIAFEGVQESARHKAGLALRFPRVARWRRDKKPADADTLGAARALLRTRTRPAGAGGLP
jgi:DNA ligase-1